MKRNILCLESLWYGKKSQQVTVQPILNMLHVLEGISFTYCPCNTEEEMAFYLRTGIGKKRGILYLAFHGYPGSLVLGNSTWLTLRDMAGKMEYGYSGWHIHFGSCATLKIGSGEVAEFMISTGASSVSGYRNYVDWVQGLAMDILLFNELQKYTNMGSLQTTLNKKYSSLIEQTGFVFLK